MIAGVLVIVTCLVAGHYGGTVDAEVSIKNPAVFADYVNKGIAQHSTKDFLNAIPPAGAVQLLA